MSLAGALFIKQPYDEDMKLFAEFVANAPDAKELVTNKNFSFTLLRENVMVERSLWRDSKYAIVERTVKIADSTTLYFFRANSKSSVNRNTVMFDEDDHCLIVNLKTGDVKRSGNRIGHLIDRSTVYKSLQ